MNLESRRHTLADFYHERTNFQFIENSKRWFVITVAVMTVAVGSLAARRLDLSIEFTGGTSWVFEVGKAADDPSISDVRDVLRPFGHADAKVTLLGNDGRGIRIVAGTLPKSELEKITKALADFGKIDVDKISRSEVGPSWGKQVSRKAIQGLLWFFVIVTLYLSFRFEWKMAFSALLAMIHDVLFTLGVYSLFQFPVTPATVIAVLTILGFSLYDTVVVFDKIQENSGSLAAGTETYGQMVNRSLNAVLMRSLNTSFVALLPVVSLLTVGTVLFGAESLRDFGVALLAGIFVGAYSSIIVATPMLAWWKEREPRYAGLRERLAGAGAPVTVEADQNGPPRPTNSPIVPRAPKPRGKKR